MAYKWGQRNTTKRGSTPAKPAASKRGSYAWGAGGRPAPQKMTDRAARIAGDTSKPPGRGAQTSSYGARVRGYNEAAGRINSYTRNPLKKGR